jgi:MYXO-CTERM domain-containing protein
VEIAKGLYAREAEFRVIASGKAKEPLLGAVLAKADLTGLFADAGKAPSDPHEPIVYVRVKVTAHHGGAVGDVTGAFRKAFFVHRDPTLHTAFPIYVGASGEGSPKLADLDADGKDELVVASADGQVHAFTAAGTELPGFPVHTGVIKWNLEHAAAAAFKPGGLKADGFYQSVVATVAVGDITGDDKPEVVVASFDGEIYAWDSHGGLLPGYPIVTGDVGIACFMESPTGCRATGVKELSAVGTKSSREMREIERGFFSSPVLYDLDADGKREIVIGGLDGFLYAFRSDGKPQAGFPVALADPSGGVRDDRGNLIKIRGRVLSTPAVGDIDADGKPEILIGTNEVYEDGTGARGYLVKGSGAPSVERSSEAYFPGWPVKLRGLRTEILPFVGRGVPTNPIMIDGDSDGKLDLLNIQTIATPGEFFDATGRKLMTTNNSVFGEKSNSTDAPVWTAINSGAVGDLDGDPYPDFANGLVGFNVLAGAGGGKRASFDHTIGAWAFGRQFKNDARKLKEEPSYVAEAAFLKGFPQVIDDHQFLTNYVIADVDGDKRNEVLGGSGGHTIHAFSADGARPGGWPKFTGGWNIATPAVGDFDGDGFLDVAAVTRDGWVYAWRTTGSATQKLSWESYHHDAMNTGNTVTPLPDRTPKKPPKKPVDPVPEPKGCGCAAGEGMSLLGAAAIFGLLARRRRK